MALWRHVLDEVGGFDPQYTKSAWREETDVCAKVGDRGYEILFVPDSVVDHVGLRRERGVTRSLRFQYSVARNEAYFVSKHRPGVLTAAVTVVVWPLRVVAHDLARVAYSLLALPVRVTGGLVGYLRGRTSRDAKKSQ
jgi:GT2 family glycosyltransferase